jgi:hypothetical protein
MAGQSGFPSPADDDLDLTPEELAELNAELDGESEPEQATDDSADAAAPPPTPATAAAPEPSASPTPVPVATAPSETPPAAPPPVSTQPVTQPFTVKVDRTAIAHPGLTRDADGTVHLSKEAWTYLHANHLGDRQQWRAREEAYQQRVRAAEQVAERQAQERSVADQRAQAIVAKFLDLHGKGPEAWQDGLLGLYDQLPVLLATAEAQFYKQQATRTQERLAPVDRETSWRQAEPTFWPQLDAEVDRALAHPDFAVLAQDRDALWQQLQDAGRQGAIAQEPSGRWFYDEHTFWNILRQESRLAAQRKEYEDRLVKAQALAARNQEALKPAATPPPPASTKTTSPTPGEVSAGKPQSWEELRRQVMAKALED